MHTEADISLCFLSSSVDDLSSVQLYKNLGVLSFVLCHNLAAQLTRAFPHDNRRKFTPHYWRLLNRSLSHIAANVNDLFYAVDHAGKTSNNPDYDYNNIFYYDHSW